MKYIEHLAWVDCSTPGCESGGRVIDSRHLDNLNASGGWSCTDHEREASR